MFDQVVVRTPRRIFRTAATVGSAVAHAAVAAVLIVATLWQVEKVDTGPVKDDVVIQLNRPPASAAAAAPGRPLEVQKRRIEKRLVKETVQPTLLPPETPPATGGTTGTGDPTQTGGGGGDGQCRKPGDPESHLPPCDDQAPPCTGEHCGGDDPPIETEVIEEPKPCNLPPHLAKGARVAGDDQIRPTRETQLEMMRSGKQTVRASFQLCVDTRGQVFSVRRLGPGTGFGAYDEALERAIHGWRYQPSVLSGCSRAATSMCTVATFVYTMKD